MRTPLMLSETAKSWAANANANAKAKAKFEALRRSGELEREKMWEAEQKRRGASLENAHVGMDKPI